MLAPQFDLVLLLDLFAFFGIVLMLEQESKTDRDYQRIQRKRKPDVVPVFDAVMSEIFFDHIAAGEASEDCAEAVSHHHE